MSGHSTKVAKMVEMLGIVNVLEWIIYLIFTRILTLIRHWFDVPMNVSMSPRQIGKPVQESRCERSRLQFHLESSSMARCRE